MMEISKKKWDELMEALTDRKEEKNKNTLLTIFAIIGAVCAVVAIAFAVYRHFSPDYLEDFEEDDEFDDYFEDDEE